MKGVEIIALKYADSFLSEAAVFHDGCTDNAVPITFVVYLLVTGQRRILVDAGCETMPGFEMRNYEKPVTVLRRFGYEPEDITDVVITHAHHDHIAAVGHYQNAVIHIHADEYAAGKKYIPEGFEVNIFTGNVSLDENITVKLIGGHSKGSCIVEINGGRKLCVIAGDECYARECLTQKRPTGSSYNVEQSKFFVDEYSKECYCVLLCHEQGIESGTKMV